MFKSLAILSILALVGCAKTTGTEERLTCKGTLVEESNRKLTVTCEDGRVFTYTTRKYSLRRNQLIME